MPAMLAYTATLACACLALQLVHTGVLAATSPSIERDDDNLIFSVPASAVVLVNKYDGSGGLVSSAPLVTQDDVDAAVEESHKNLQAQLDAKEDRLKVLEATVLKLASAEEVAGKADDTDVTKLKDDVAVGATKLDSLRTEFDEAVKDLVELADQNEAKSSCLSNVVGQIGAGAIDKCPNATGALTCGTLGAPKHGSAKGTSRIVGAIRLWSCATGFKLSGATTAVCGKDFKWTNAMPACLSTVTCAMVTDDDTLGVWIDGKRIGTKSRPGAQSRHQWTRLEQFSFASDAKVLAIKYRNQQPCLHGGMAITCGTNAGDSPWNAKSEVGNKKWKIFTHINSYVLTGEEWTKPTFDASKWGKAQYGFTNNDANFLPRKCLLLDKPGVPAQCGGAQQVDRDRYGKVTGPIVPIWWCDDSSGNADKCRQGTSPKIADAICADEEDDAINVVKYAGEGERSVHHFVWNRFTPAA